MYFVRTYCVGDFVVSDTFAVRCIGVEIRTIGVEDLEQITTLKEEILCGVFCQKAATWFGCRAEKVQVTALSDQLDVHANG